MVKRAYLLALAAGAGLAAWATMVLRGQFLHVFLAVCCLAAAAAMALLWVVLFALRQRAHRVAALRHACGWVAVILIVVSCSYLPGAMVGGRDVREAQQFCEQIAAAADRWRKEHGSYPESLSDVLPEGGPPRLLGEAQDFYVSDGDGYVLSFSDQTGLVESGMMYTSQQRQWLRVPRNDGH
jgi:hypothetical protein